MPPVRDGIPPRLHLEVPEPLGGDGHVRAVAIGARRQFVHVDQRGSLALGPAQHHAGAEHLVPFPEDGGTDREGFSGYRLCGAAPALQDGLDVQDGNASYHPLKLPSLAGCARGGRPAIDRAYPGPSPWSPGGSPSARPGPAPAACPGAVREPWRRPGRARPSSGPTARVTSPAERAPQTDKTSAGTHVAREKSALAMIIVTGDAAGAVGQGGWEAALVGDRPRSRCVRTRADFGAWNLVRRFLARAGYPRCPGRVRCACPGTPSGRPCCLRVMFSSAHLGRNMSLTRSH